MLSQRDKKVEIATILFSTIVLFAWLKKWVVESNSTYIVVFAVSCIGLIGSKDSKQVTFSVAKIIPIIGSLTVMSEFLLLSEISSTYKLILITSIWALSYASAQLFDVFDPRLGALQINLSSPIAIVYIAMALMGAFLFVPDTDDVLWLAFGVASLAAFSALSQVYPSSLLYTYVIVIMFSVRGIVGRPEDSVYLVIMLVAVLLSVYTLQRIETKKEVFPLDFSILSLLIVVGFRLGNSGLFSNPYAKPFLAIGILAIVALRLQSNLSKRRILYATGNTRPPRD